MRRIKQSFRALKNQKIKYVIETTEWLKVPFGSFFRCFTEGREEKLWHFCCKIVAGSCRKFFTVIVMTDKRGNEHEKNDITV